MKMNREKPRRMERRSAKRKKRRQNPSPAGLDDEDRISNLPDDILHHVYSFLPIKCAARTGVLSKRWRNLWYSFPYLDFTSVASPEHESAVANLSMRQQMERLRSQGERAVEYADQILRLLEKHSGVRVLRLRAFFTSTMPFFLIRDAVKHNLQELVIEDFTYKSFEPRSLASSNWLRAHLFKPSNPYLRLLVPILRIIKDEFRSVSVLSLSHLSLCYQPLLTNLFTDSSFRLLKNLHLEACSELKHLRVESPALEDLCLESCSELQELEICLHKLKKLRVSSCFDAYISSSRVKIEAPNLEILFWSNNPVTEKCILQNLKCLREAFVGFFVLREDLSSVKITSLWNFLAGISCCHSLTLKSQCIEDYHWVHSTT